MESATFSEFTSPALSIESGLPTDAQAGSQSPVFAGTREERDQTTAAAPVLSLPALDGALGDADATAPTADATTPGSSAVPGLLSPSLSGAAAAQAPAQTPAQTPRQVAQQVTIPRFETPELFENPTPGENVNAPEYLEPERTSTPTQPSEQARARRPRSPFDLDSGSDEEVSLFGRVTSESLTDFRNPLDYDDVLVTSGANRRPTQTTEDIMLPGFDF